MNKYFSLIKAIMSEGINVFKINTKNKSKFFKLLMPIILTLIIMGIMCSYSISIILKLQTINMEVLLLTMFILFTSFLTLLEGIYKSSSLLFNCRDDDLLLSLPIPKSIVLFVRVLKFYLFELLYNTLFIFPAIFVYAIYMHPSITYYIVSLFGLFLFPIIPILLSCLIGAIIVYMSSLFKNKNIVQTILSVILVFGIMYLSFNAEKILENILNNAYNINNLITTIYYPAKAYIELIINYSTIQLLKFITINLALFCLTIVLIGKIYFRINSSSKAIKFKKSNKPYIIKSSNPIWGIIKKELNRFLNSPVFIINSAFSLIFFILGCILLANKFDVIASTITEMNSTINFDFIKKSINIILFIFISISSFLTTITCSMISLEGKSFNILKIIPIKPYTIINAKILTSLLIMIPCILIGDVIVFFRFQFDILSIILILISSVLFPLLSQTMGIIINLKYPRLDAKNDTEIVKQSMSSFLSVFSGFGLITITVFIVFKLLEYNVSNYFIMISFIIGYLILYLLLLLFLNKTCDKSFRNILV